MRTAVFAGSFDPFTLGHKDIVLRAAKLFDRIIVAVAEDTGKKTRLLADRKKIITLSLDEVENVEIASFSGLLTDFMKERGLTVLIRGVRNAMDFDYESSLMGVYRSLYKEIEFILLPSKSELSHVSSTVVRELLKIGADTKDYLDTKAEEFTRSLYLER